MRALWLSSRATRRRVTGTESRRRLQERKGSLHRIFPFLGMHAVRLTHPVRALAAS